MLNIDVLQTQEVLNDANDVRRAKSIEGSKHPLQFQDYGDGDE